jgi:hypothetical protein
MSRTQFRNFCKLASACFDSSLIIGLVALGFIERSPFFGIAGVDFYIGTLENLVKKIPVLKTGISIKEMFLVYFFLYITSFTNFTVRGTSGRAAAKRLGA